MDNENMDAAPEVLETPEPVEETVDTPEVEEETLSADEISALKAKAAKTDELEAKNKQLYERVKKGEAKPAPVPEVQTQGMSVADAAALIKNDVHEDDYSRVEKYAKDNGLTLRDALKTDELKAILGVYAEKRTTANAANVSNVRRGPSKLSDDVLMSNAEKGKLPDTDDDIDRLIAAKIKAGR